MDRKDYIPVVIGVGDIKNNSKRLEDAIEPADLMFKAIEEAIQDSGLSDDATNKLRSKIDSIDVVATWTWPYTDLPGLLSEKLKVKPRHKHYSSHGGNFPGKLFDDAARRISQGKSRVAVITGGEALASCIYLDSYMPQMKCADPILNRSGSFRKGG